MARGLPACRRVAWDKRWRKWFISAAARHRSGDDLVHQCLARLIQITATDRSNNRAKKV
jgi:hypothetical protein